MKKQLLLQLILVFTMFFSTFSSAQNYTVQQIPYTFLSTAGIPVTNMVDDQVYGPFPIGFDFCFYGQTYTQFYIGSNGWVSFSPGQPGSWSISAQIPSPSASYCKNCIMGPFEDWLPFGSSTNVFYETRGTEPCRQLVVTFLDIALFGGSCNTLLGTFQIVLNETTNLIENHLFTKPSCPSWNSGNSIQGVHNLTGTLATTVPNRNAQPFTANQESWRYTPQGFCSGTLDTIRVLTNDTSRYDYPVVNATCFDTSFYINLNTPVFCNTIDPNGSDFRLYDHLGRLVQIKNVEFSCSNNYTDSLIFHVTEPLLYEEEYFLVQRIGYDGNTIGNCLSFRPAFDTVLVNVDNCYKYDEAIKITNVSVIKNDDIEIRWKYPDTLDVGFFERYVLYVNDTLGGNQWFVMAENLNINDTVATISNYDPDYERRDWRLRLKIKYYPLAPPGDEASHMFLSNNDQTLFNGMRGSSKIEWNPYLLWANPVYKIYDAKAEDTVWTLLGTTTDTSFIYEKQRLPITYFIKVETETPDGRLLSSSNYLRYTQQTRDIEIVNVATPNGDGVNDEVYIRGIDFYPGSSMRLFNRWGQMVYESMDYRNDWSPTNLEGGTYFCVVEVPDKGVFRGAIEIIK